MSAKRSFLLTLLCFAWVFPMQVHAWDRLDLLKVGSAVALWTSGTAAVATALLVGRLNEVRCVSQSDEAFCCKINTLNGSRTQFEMDCMQNATLSNCSNSPLCLDANGTVYFPFKASYEANWYTPVITIGATFVVAGMGAFWSIHFPCHSWCGGK